MRREEENVIGYSINLQNNIKIETIFVDLDLRVAILKICASFDMRYCEVDIT